MEFTGARGGRERVARAIGVRGKMVECGESCWLYDGSTMRWVVWRVACMSAALSGVLACGPSAPSVANPPSSGSASVKAQANKPTPCQVATVERARLTALLEQGKLDRARRVIGRANELSVQGGCKADIETTWATEARTLAELGRWSDLRALATMIESEGNAPDHVQEAVRGALDLAAKLDVKFDSTDEAKAAMRETYKRAISKESTGENEAAYALYLQAWELWRPNGQALAQAGQLAQRLGRAADAQRLFDRAIVELEQATGKQLTLDVANGFGRGGPRDFAWGAAGRIAVWHDNGISILAQGNLREVARINAWGPVAFSRDGGVLAVASDGDITLWDVNGESIKVIKGDGDSSVLSIALTSDGKQVITDSLSGRLSFWDVASGQKTHHWDHASLLALSADGQKAVVASFEYVGLINPQTGRELRKFGDLGPSVSAAFSPDNARLALTSPDNVVHVWDLAKGRELKPLLAAHTDGPVGLTFSPDGNLLALDAEYGTLVVDVSSGRQVQELRASNLANRSVFSPDGRYLAAISDRLRLWEIASGTLLQELGDHGEVVVGSAFAPSGERLAVSLADKTVRVRDAKTGRELQRIEGLDARSLTFSPNGQILAFLSPDDKALHLWDVTSQKEVHKVSAISSSQLAFSPDGQLLAAALRNNAVCIWDVATGQERARFKGKTGGVPKQVAFLSNNTLLTGAPHDPAIWLWDIRSGEAVKKVIDSHSPFVLSPDHRKIGFAINEETIGIGALTDLNETSAPKLTLLPGAQNSTLAPAAFSPDNAFFVGISGGDDFTIYAWSVATGTLVKAISDRTNPIWDVMFSPDSKLLMSRAHDNAIVMWRVPDFELLGMQRSVKGAHADYVFSPDGYIDFSGEEADKARAYPLCRIGVVALPFAVCQERFESPGLYAKLVTGDMSYREP